MRRIAGAIVASVLSGAYWWIVFTFVHADALFGGDRDMAAPQPDARLAETCDAAVLVAAVAVHAGLLWLWRYVRSSRRS